LSSQFHKNPKVHQRRSIFANPQQQEGLDISVAAPAVRDQQQAQLASKLQTRLINEAIFFRCCCSFDAKAVCCLSRQLRGTTQIAFDRGAGPLALLGRFASATAAMAIKVLKPSMHSESGAAAAGQCHLTHHHPRKCGACSPDSRAGPSRRMCALRPPAENPKTMNS